VNARHDDRWHGQGVMLLLWTAVATLAGQAAEPSSGTPAPAREIPYRIQEKANDGVFAVTLETRKVDANSDLVVSFQVPTNLPAATASPEWLRLTNLLTSVEEAFAERAALRERLRTLNLRDTNAVEALRKDNQAFDRRSFQRRLEWQAALGLANDDDAFERILYGDFDGQGNVRQPYANLARYVRKELERVNQAARQWVDSRSVEVTVQAFHSPIGSGRQAVHVNGYDNIPAGDLQPIDRRGLRLTPAEQARLAMEMEMSEQAAKSIREIQKSSGEIGALTGQLLTQLKARLARLEQTLAQGPAAWSNVVGDDAVLQPLQALVRDAADPATRAAANLVLTNLAGFKEDLAQLPPLVAQLQGLRSLLAPEGGAGLGQVLLGPGGLLTQVKPIVNSITTLARRVATWPARAEALAKGLDEIGQALTAEQKAALLPAEAKDFVTSVAGLLPETLRALELIGGVLGDSDVAQGAATLAGANIEPIWRDPSHLVDGTLELARAGLTQGDEMLLQVSYRRAGTNGAPAVLLSEDAYKLNTVLMGFHREFGASVIFARGLRGDGYEQQWKPNVAAHVHWFYRYRDDSGAWRKTWNFLNPGLGLHMASLDQNPDDGIEIGMGVNMSLLDGVIVGGVGFNLTNDQRPYAFVGLSLLDLLESAKKLKR
jgi:hypothetical protein